MAARWEMLLSPGTVISVSIRGARFTRSSIGSVQKLFAQPAQPHGIQSHVKMSIGYKMRLSSWRWKFVVRFCATNLPARRRIRERERFCPCTGPSPPYLERIPLRPPVYPAKKDSPPRAVYFRPRSCWRGRRGRFLGRGIFRRRGIRVERLLLRRILLAFRRSIGDAVTGTWRRLLHVSARREKEGGEQHERQRKFHKNRFDEITSILIHCQSLNRLRERHANAFAKIEIDTVARPAASESKEEWTRNPTIEFW